MRCITRYGNGLVLCLKDTTGIFNLSKSFIESDYYFLYSNFAHVNRHLGVSEVHFYPLRPELAESTYLLYRATKNPFYLHVGKEILDSINNHTKVK